MIRLHYIKPNNLATLHDQILAAHPELRTVMTVSGLGNDIWLDLPATTAQGVLSDLDAIVAAHVPPPPPRAVDYGSDLPPRDTVVDVVSQLRQYLGVASPTLVQTATALKLVIRVLLFLTQRLVG
jgi:hypothetical protein